ncbi:uncharacterized protein [Dermacentor andersoni]|uniref:uncharacterized protein n=1 Tax=Dermacentor andersoni TaxID=34620 RepID=UPI002416D9C2|nr:zonadhesin-like [Dermacentor andersoni]
MRKRTGQKHITARDVVCTTDRKVKIRFAVRANESENVIAATKQCTRIPGKEGQCLIGDGVYMKADSIKSREVTSPPSTTVELTTARASTENASSIPSEQSTDSTVSVSPVTKLQTRFHASTMSSPTATPVNASLAKEEASTSIPTDVTIRANETASESGTTRSTADFVPTSNTTGGEVTSPPSTTVELTTARASTENASSIPSEQSTDSTVSVSPVTKLQTRFHASTMSSPTATQVNASLAKEEASTSIPTDVTIRANETASESGTTRSTADFVPTSNTTGGEVTSPPSTTVELTTARASTENASSIPSEQSTDSTVSVSPVTKLQTRFHASTMSSPTATQVNASLAKEEASTSIPTDVTIRANETASESGTTRSTADFVPTSNTTGGEVTSPPSTTVELTTARASTENASSIPSEQSTDSTVSVSPVTKLQTRFHASTMSSPTATQVNASLAKEEASTSIPTDVTIRANETASESGTTRSTADFVPTSNTTGGEVTSPPSTTVELTTASASTENASSIPSEESTDSTVSFNPVTELQTTSHASTMMSPTTTQVNASFPEREATTSITTNVAIRANETASESGTTRSTMDAVSTSNTTDLCRTFGVEICGALPCVQTRDMFECKCDDSQYFDSAAKECQSIHNCNVQPCKVGKCEDDNGKSNRTCICDNPDLTEDCNVSKAKETICSDKNAMAKLNDDGNVECVCQEGFKMIGDKCIDVICLDYSSTCKTLCQTTDLGRAQNQGCCVGWKNESCEAHPPKESCDPGYVFRNGSCTDACTAGEAGKMCNRGCTPGAEHSGVPFYCNCGENEQFNNYTLLCEARSQCNSDEENNCTANGYSQCFMKQGAHNCTCRESELYNGERCTSTCSKKALEACRERKAECAIKGNTEECVCRLPKAFNGDDVCTQDGIKVIEIEFQISEPTSMLYSIAVVDREREEIAEAVRAKTGHKHVTAENVIYNRDNSVGVKFGVGLKDSRRTLSTLLHCQRIPMFPNHCLMGNGIFFRANSLHATWAASIVQEEVMVKARITRVTAGAKMNFVVVSICLGSLLLFGIIVSASIIVRMRRKLLRLRHQSAQPEHGNSYGGTERAHILSTN